MLPGIGDYKQTGEPNTMQPSPLSKLIAQTEKDLALGPKRHWSNQQKVVADREIHYKLILNAQSIIGKERKQFDEKMKIQRKLFDTSEAKIKAKKLKEAGVVKENKRMLRRLLKIEMTETEITRTNARGPERERILTLKRARKKALRNSKQFAIDKLNRENAVMLKRINNARGAFNKNNWKKDFAEHKKRRKFMSKMPSVRKKDKPRNKGSQSLPSLNPRDRDPGEKFGFLPTSNQLEISNDSEFLASLWNDQKKKQEAGTIGAEDRIRGGGANATSVAEQLELIQKLGQESRDANRKTSAIPPQRPNYEDMSVAELNLCISEMAAELSPNISMSSFKAMVADMPRKVLIKTLIDVWTAKHDASALKKSLSNGGFSTSMRGAPQSDTQLFLSRGPTVNSFSNNTANTRKKNKKHKKKKRRDAAGEKRLIE